jgi:hypothetical protein
MLFTGNSDCNDINDLANLTHQRKGETLHVVFCPMGIRASGHQGIRASGIRASGIRASGHQAIRASGYQGIRVSGHQGIRPSGILGRAHRLYSLSRFQQRSAFCSSCHMKTMFYIYFIDIYAALY